MKLPFAKDRVSSGFGRRRDPITAQISNHPAVDFAVPAGSKIPAIAQGFVKSKRFTATHGNTITIEHIDAAGETYTARYCHMRHPSELTAHALVLPGETVGIVGATGSSARGDHLHLEIRHNGDLIDPLTVLR